MVYGPQSMANKQRTIDYRLWTTTVLLIVAFACTQNKKQSQHESYTCPMHPTVIQDMPGTCPVCAMDLVQKGLPGEEVKITAELNYLLKPTNAMVISSIKTVMPVQKEMEITTKANGIITYDTRRITSVPIRFGGRIEKLSIKYNFQPIRKGQKILEIYSPDLVTAQRDLLYLIKSDKENSQLIEGAKEKLRLLGVSNSQIDRLISTGEESYSFNVFSPVDGYVVEEAALTSPVPISPKTASSAMDGGMANEGKSNSVQTLTPVSSSELLTREGMYVSAGQSVFKVVNTEYVWAEFDVYQRDAASIKINDLAHLTFDNTTETIESKVNFVQPFFKSGESFVKVRVYLSNVGSPPAGQAGKLRIGQLVTAQFTITSKEAIWIPQSARLNLGTKEITFIKRRGVFRPKEIVTAHQSGNWIEVLSGLEASDSVSYNAQFMVDSESFIKVKN